ncbi:19528_t:CDS:1, partial [Gigaspora margarita]
GRSDYMKTDNLKVEFLDESYYQLLEQEGRNDKIISFDFYWNK